jgi:hypothetical protein
MTTFQIGTLVVVALLVITSFVDVKALWGRFMVKKTPLKDLPTDIMVDIKADPRVNPVPSISEIVEQWDKLKTMCLAAGSKASAKELDNVFLFLLEKGDKV